MSPHLPQPAEGTWAAAMGIRFLRADADEAVAELTIEKHHLQAHGIVHGGVYAGLIETVTSLGATLAARRRQPGTAPQLVGLENHTSFLKGASAGHLTARAVPVHVGATTHTWSATIVDEAGTLLATGTVRLLSRASP